MRSNKKTAQQSEGAKLHNQIGALIDQRQRALLVIVDWIRDRESEDTIPDIPLSEIPGAVDEIHRTIIKNLPMLVTDMSTIFIAASRYYLTEGLNDDMGILALESQHAAIRFFERLMTLQVKS